MRNQTKKIILVGAPKAGKTSMRQIIFAHYTPQETVRLQQTIEIGISAIEILGRCVNIMDIPGGHYALDRMWFEETSGPVFSNVDVTIFVLDCVSERWISDLKGLVNIARNLQLYSPNSQLIVMIHKIDLIEGYDSRLNNQQSFNAKFDRYKDQIKRMLTEEFCPTSSSSGKCLDPSESSDSATLSETKLKLEKIVEKINYKCSTIYDESLYRAWAEVISSIMPNIGQYRDKAETFCRGVNADLVAIFENKTHLSITSFQQYGRNIPPDQNDSECSSSENSVRQLNEFTSKLRARSRQNEIYRTSSRKRRKALDFEMKTKKYQLFFKEITPQLCVLVVFYTTSQRKAQNFGLYQDKLGPSTVIVPERGPGVYSSPGSVSIRGLSSSSTSLGHRLTTSTYSTITKSGMSTASAMHASSTSIQASIPSNMVKSGRSEKSTEPLQTALETSIDSLKKVQINRLKNRISQENLTKSYTCNCNCNAASSINANMATAYAACALDLVKDEEAICEYPATVELAIREFSEEIKLLEREAQNYR